MFICNKYLQRLFVQCILDKANPYLAIFTTSLWSIYIRAQENVTIQRFKKWPKYSFYSTNSYVPPM